jgi:hypothetical protein
MYLSVSILIQGYGPLFATHVYFPIGYLHIFFNLIIEDTFSNFFTNIMEKVVHLKLWAHGMESKKFEVKNFILHGNWKLKRCSNQKNFRD